MILHLRHRPSVVRTLLCLVPLALVACVSTTSTGGGQGVVADTESDAAVTDVAAADAPPTDAQVDADADATPLTDVPSATDTAAPDSELADAGEDAALDAAEDATSAADAELDTAADVAPDAAPLCTDNTSCADGDVCTADTCTANGCVHTAIANCVPPAAPCAANSPCKTGVCDLASNTCVACLSSADCPAAAACKAQICVMSTACATDVACKASQQVCDKVAGVCVDCLSAVDCASNQACVANTCVAAQPCKSSKECLAVCDSASGLCVECLADTDCLANQFCAGNAVCVPDVCSGPSCGADGALFDCKANGSGYLASAGCDDGNVCTADGCQAGAGCTHLPASATCTDGNACTADDLCANGQCAPGTAVGCDDLNPCTADSCAPAVGCQHSAANDGAACSDSSLCTFNDVCAAGQCTGSAAKCEDANPCTDDGCDPAAGCVFFSNTKPCDDANACTSGDACAAGACGAGPPVTCDDANACTDNTCDTKLGCVFLPNTATCTDGSACTDGDACKTGNCVSGTGCSDGNLCTVDACDPAVGCSYAKSSCDDGDACTVDACDPLTGKCSNTPGPGCCTAGKVLYSRDFDDGSTASLAVKNASNSATKGWQVWAGAKQAHSPKNALWYGDLATGTYDIGGNGATSGTATVGPIAIPTSLPAGATLQLSLWTYVDVENCVDFDKFSISATNGATTTALWNKSNLPAGAGPSSNCSGHITLPSGWLQLTLALPFAAGDFVSLQFNFDSVDGQYNATSGVFVDDIQILQQCK